MKPLPDRLRALSLALMGVLALRLLVEVRPPSAGEPLALRWARTAASHPLRVVLSLLLIGTALAPRRARSLPIRPSSARGAGASELE